MPGVLENLLQLNVKDPKNPTLFSANRGEEFIEKATSL